MGEAGGGIIPARAGFTAAPWCGSRRSPDHPRSRGVYAHGGSVMNNLDGSSPLARGLLRSVGPLDVGRRIIPARAGFTWRGRTAAAAGRDHPRSRGVYGDRLSEQQGVTRIIPARAGFTSLGCLRGTTGSDHPRSRGVYDAGVRRYYLRIGSSPLARGLPWSSGSTILLGRIIPARAGFTLGDRRDSNGGPPYQGAFAFTGDLGTARLSCGSVVAGQRSTTTPSPV